MQCPATRASEQEKSTQNERDPQELCSHVCDRYKKSSRMVAPALCTGIFSPSLLRVKIYLQSLIHFFAHFRYWEQDSPGPDATLEQENPGLASETQQLCAYGRPGGCASNGRDADKLQIRRR